MLTPMKLGKAMCTDCKQAARSWSKLAKVRVPTSTEQIRVESGERGLRVERGTEGKLEGRAMLGMVTERDKVGHLTSWKKRLMDLLAVRTKKQRNG